MHAEITMNRPNEVIAACVIVEYSETIAIDVTWPKSLRVLVDEIESEFTLSLLWSAPAKQQLLLVHTPMLCAYR